MFKLFIYLSHCFNLFLLLLSFNFHPRPLTDFVVLSIFRFNHLAIRSKGLKSSSDSLSTTISFANFAHLSSYFRSQTNKIKLFNSLWRAHKMRPWLYLLILNDKNQSVLPIDMLENWSHFLCRYYLITPNAAYLSNCFSLFFYADNIFNHCKKVWERIFINTSGEENGQKEKMK